MPDKSGIGVKHALTQRIGYLIFASFDRLTVMAKQRGYWQESDGSPVAAADAQEVWATHAYDALTETARTYHAVITYRDLGKRVQEESGIRTTALLQNWIGLVLGKVIQETVKRGEPPLTSLVVHADDGMVGVGYGAVLEAIGQPPLADERAREEHAAQSRLECYRFFGAEIPESGGWAVQSPRRQAVLNRLRAQAEPTPQVQCPNCFIAIPNRGTCDTCGYEVAAASKV
jgi:hypothetical protein